MLIVVCYCHVTTWNPVWMADIKPHVGRLCLSSPVSVASSEVLSVCFVAVLRGNQEVADADQMWQI